MCIVHGFPRTTLREAANKLSGIRKSLNEELDKVDRKNVRMQSNKDRKIQREFLDKAEDNISAQIVHNEAEIKRLTDERNAKEQSKGKKLAGVIVQDELAAKAGIPPEAPPPSTNASEEGSWTSISVVVTSTYSTESNESSGKSIQGKVSYWDLFTGASVGGSYQDSHFEAAREMANASMRISFECMRVDINRPWLRPELFSDPDLRVADTDQYVFLECVYYLED